VLGPFGTGGSVGAPADGRLWEMGWDAVLQGAMQILGICIGICIACSDACKSTLGAMLLCCPYPLRGSLRGSLHPFLRTPDLALPVCLSAARSSTRI
jgi:hypothetical protein